MRYDIFKVFETYWYSAFQKEYGNLWNCLLLSISPNVECNWFLFFASLRNDKYYLTSH